MTKSKTSPTLDDLHSSYWLDDFTGVFADEEQEDTALERIMKLAAIRRATANFVRILTNDSTIQVKYSSGNASYTDGKTVVISADDNPQNFDSMVGLALHEGAHCLLTDFAFLQTIAKDDLVFFHALHPKLRKRFPSKKLTEMTEHEMAVLRTLRKYIQLVMNVIEDRRIDSYVYTMASGYRPYYNAMYTKYFFNKDTETNLRRNPEWRIPTVENYINWLICMFSPHFNPRAMRGLTKMVKLIDLPNIRRFDENAIVPPVTKWTIDANNHFEFDQFSPLWKVANEVMIEILRQAELEAMENDQSRIQFGDVELEIGEGEESDDAQGDELENLDPVEMGKFNVERGKKGLAKVKISLNGQNKKKKLTRVEKEQVETMESADAKLTENGDPLYGKVPCLVTKSISRQIMESEWFPFSRAWRDYSAGKTVISKDRMSEEGVLDGLRMGAILAQRLSVRNDANTTHFTRQSRGKIDRRILAQLGMDIESVFKRSTVDQYNPVLLYLSIDASGSMGGYKWKRVMTVATALAYAAERIRNLDVVISLRGNGLGSGVPCVAVVHDSRKDKFSRVRDLFPYLMCNGSTPEGLCYLATMDLIEECARTHTTYFINFSDGEPGSSFRYNGHYYNYGGETAQQQTRNMMRQIREAGIKVMSYFIGEHKTSTYGTYGRSAFTVMYGQDAEFVDVKNVTQVLKTLNKLLLEK